MERTIFKRPAWISFLSIMVVPLWLLHAGLAYSPVHTAGTIDPPVVDVVSPVKS